MKSNLNWLLEECRNQFFLLRRPWKTISVMGKAKKVPSRTTDAKIKFIEGETQRNPLRWWKNYMNPFYPKRPMENIIIGKKIKSFLSKEKPVKTNYPQGEVRGYWRCWLEIHETKFTDKKNLETCYHSRKIHKIELRSQRNHRSWFHPWRKMLKLNSTTEITKKFFKQQEKPWKNFSVVGNR